MDDRIRLASGRNRLEAARLGDHRAFGDLLRHHDPRARSVAIGIVGPMLADDALQEAYVKAFRKLAAFDGRAQFSTWLHRIVVNACLDQLRRDGKHPSDPVGLGLGSDAPTVGISQSFGNRVETALLALPTDQRVAIVLVDVEGYSYAEAAELMGTAPGTVSSRVSRARAALRPMLDEHCDNTKGRRQ